MKNVKFVGKESALLKKISLAVKGAKLFRNNVGLFKTIDGRTVKTGLCKGSSDLIGWTPVTITEEMVGANVAVFTAIEVKVKGGRESEQQRDFISAVERAGGVAGFCYSVEDALALVAKNIIDND